MARSLPFRWHQKKPLCMSPKSRAPKRTNAVALQPAAPEGCQFRPDLHPQDGTSTRKCATSRMQRNALKTVVDSFPTQGLKHLIRVAKIQQQNPHLEHADPLSRSSIYSPLARPR
jgi:hypothetical protein